MKQAREVLESEEGLLAEPNIRPHYKGGITPLSRLRVTIGRKPPTPLW